MKKQYNDEDIRLFLKQFKQLPEYFELEKVHHLINNPEAKATLKDRTIFKNLKFIIMTSTFITGLSILLLWVTPNKNNIAKVQDRSGSDKVTIIAEVQNKKTSAVNDKTYEKAKFMGPKSQNNRNAKESDLFANKKTDVDEGNKPTMLTKNLGCDWPEDTVLDKHSLFVYLTTEELAGLGVFIYKKDSVYYHNRTPDGKSNIVSGCNIKIDETKYTTFEFFLADGSDTACTTHRWGDIFYQRIDTLIPILWISDKTRIMWFTSHHSIFSALPSRYQYLEAIYDHLKCLKKKNPNHQYVNYWDEQRNIILDRINYLELSNDELQKIGVGIFKDSVSLVDPTQSFKYLLNDHMLNCGTYSINGSKVPDIPNMFPILLTDIKGLNQGTYGSWIKNQKQNDNQYSREIFNTLIPVYLPISRLIRGINYDLITWYYPTEEFLQALPERCRDVIKSEIESIKSGENSGKSSCTYFEVCKSTLHLADFNAYPNPVSGMLTVEFSSQNELHGTVSLVNISGSELKVLVPQTSFPKGFQSYIVDLSNINPGIYLISINTDKGFKTQRIVVSR